MGDATSPEGLAAHLFRRHGARLVARIAQVLGARHLSLAEDAVQDALVAALERWPYEGVPDRPEAWLSSVARRRAIDRVRRSDEAATRLGDELERELEQADEDPVDALDDAQLALLLASAQPDLPPGSQVAFTLKVACGLSTNEIARALALPRATVQQRIVRAKRTLAERTDSLVVPEGDAITPRLRAVHEALYATFSEGYLATAGDEAIRRDLVEEALRLTGLLAEHPRGDRPEGHALVALMSFHASRSAARLDDAGALLLLADQDRARWDRRLIVEGFLALERAQRGDVLSRWHVEAGIAACHAAAPSFEVTDWRQVAELYDILLEGWPTDVVRLNRAVAVAERDGAEAGLNALEAIERPEAPERGHLFHSVRGVLLQRVGRDAEAREAFERALGCPATAAEHDVVRRRLGDST